MKFCSEHVPVQIVNQLAVCMDIAKKLFKLMHGCIRAVVNYSLFFTALE